MTNLLTQEEVAERLGLKASTLEMWRSHKRYDLPYIKMGRLVRYKQEDVEKFIESWGKMGGDNAARSSA